MTNLHNRSSPGFQIYSMGFIVFIASRDYSP
jgi:hypothetical protein